MWSTIVFYLYLQLLFIICDLKSMDILSILENLYLHTLDISLTASMVIVAVMLVRLCLKRVPRIYSYALWSIVLIRLLCPVFPVSDVSVIPVIDSVWEVKRIIYGDETMDDYRNALFWISEEGYLTVSDDRMPINEGEDGLKFAAFSLSHELFDELFVDNEVFWATGRNLSRSIRHRNAGAWRILVEQSDRGPMLYYLLEQANDKVYLLMGRYDKENLGDWFDDNSRFWWMCELQRIENEEYPEKEVYHE